MNKRICLVSLGLACIGFSLLATGCGSHSGDSSANDKGTAQTSEAIGGCYLGGVNDRGVYNGYHYWEVYGDFTCAHGSSYPTVGADYRCSPQQTYGSSYQVNFRLPDFHDDAACYITISSWWHEFGFEITY